MQAGFPSVVKSLLELVPIIFERKMDLGLYCLALNPCPSNKDVPVGGKKVTVEQITREHWAKYGRNFFSRYDYEAA